MPIRLLQLLPLGEAYNIPDDTNEIKALEVYLNHALHTDRTPHTFNIKKTSDNKFDVIIDNKIKIDAFPIFWSNNKIKGWKFSNNGTSATMEYSVMHGYQGDFVDFFNLIVDELEGKLQSQNVDDGSNIKISVDSLTKLLLTIKKIIDAHSSKDYWYYKLTDAHNTYVEGSKQITQIKKLYPKLPKQGRVEIFNYWNSKAPSMFKYNDFEEFNRNFAS